MTGPDPELTGQPMPREGEPTPRQVREALRILHGNGHDFTYKQAWSLVRAVLRQEEEDRVRAEAFALLDGIFGMSIVDAKHEVEQAIAHYRA